MVKKIVKYELEEGGFILVEVEKLEEETCIVPAGGEEIFEEATVKFEEALDKIRPVVNSVIQKFTNLSQEPNQIAVEFGLNMNANSGVLIASAGVEANFKINISWKK